MKKILINVYVPIVGIGYDVFIPYDSPMSEVILLLEKAVAELSDGQFLPSESTILCMRDTGEILDINYKVFELGIKNGSKLMII